MHPDVIAQIDKINEGNRQNLVQSKADLVGTLQKKAAQCQAVQGHAIFHAGHHQETHLVGPIVQQWEGGLVRQQEPQNFVSFCKRTGEYKVVSFAVRRFFLAIRVS
jgi:hypothetical protein